MAWKKWKYQMKSYEKEAYEIRSDEMFDNYYKELKTYKFNKRKVLKEYNNSKPKQKVK